MNDRDVSADPQLSPSYSGYHIARDLAGRFADAGHELYLVGGAVRDMLLGHDVTELDFATSARPEETVRILETRVDAGPYRVGEKYGTVGGVVDGFGVEVTTYRSGEVYRPDSRKPQVRFGDTIGEDLGRRDFTINAIAVDPRTDHFMDPYGGRHDLNARIIRAVGDPARRFSEDPLRLLRAVRFAARFGFELEESTWKAIAKQAARLRTISRERIRDEYVKILTGPRAATGLTLLRDGKLMETSVPGLMELDRMADHGPRHPLSLWEHTMRVVEGVPPEPTVRWAALLHDIGKPSTRSFEPNGRIRFYHHEIAGAAMARKIMTGLRFPHNLVHDVALLVETHMQLHAYSADWSDGAVRRLMLRLGSLLPAALQLARADAAGHSLGAPSYNAPKFDALESRIAALGQERVQTLQSPLSGRDLMERYNRPPGPWIGAIKQALLDEVVEGRLGMGDRETAWRMADELIEVGE